MGLDITAYERVELLSETHTDEHYDMDDVIVVSQIPEFIGRERPLIEGAAYRASGERIDFRAGSYSGYNLWRRTLAEMSSGRQDHFYWASKDTSLPFYPLVNFADNEGVLGSYACASLANDFDSYAAKAVDADGVVMFFLERYEFWRRACRMAAESGCVRLH